MKYSIDRVDMKTLSIERLEEDDGLPEELDIDAMINVASYRLLDFIEQDREDEDEEIWEPNLPEPFHYHWLSGGTVILFNDFRYGENHTIIRALFE